MDKYFLPVYHSQLKPWIKWWILKRLNGGQSSLKAVTISSGTLTKVDKSKALSIKEYYGNTVQNGTPTPESPVEIKTISGDNTFTINGGDYRLDLGGKNKLPNNAITQTLNGITFTVNEDKSITLNGTSTQGFVVELVNNLILDSGAYNLSLSGKIQGCGIYAYVGSNNLKAYVSSNNPPTNWQSNFTLDSQTTFTQVRLDIRNATTFDNVTIFPQIEKGTEATPYESYYNYELCKIGDYKDKIYNDNGTWKVEKNIGKVVLNGSENWIKHGSIASWFYYDGVTNGYFNNATDNFALTNYFAQKSYSSVVNLTNGEFAYGSSDNGATHRLVCKDTNYTATQDFKDWLSTHNVSLYYQLATPTTETITNTNLISQLNALYEFYVNSSTVSISNNSEIPLEVLLEYYGR